MDAKTSGWDLEDYIDHLQVSPDKILVNHKVVLQRGEKSHLTVEKFGPSHLNQMIKANITGTETETQQPMSPDTVPWEGHSTAATGLLPRAHDLNAIARGHHTDPKEGLSYNMSGQHYEKIPCHERKEI